MWSVCLWLYMFLRLETDSRGNNEARKRVQQGGYIRRCPYNRGPVLNECVQSYNVSVGNVWRAIRGVNLLYFRCYLDAYSYHNEIIYFTF